MKITEGLFDNMVLQRAQGNRSDAAFAGECSAAGSLRATVRAQGRVLAGFNDLEVGAAARGRFSGRLRGLPAGGPYDIELSVADAQGAALRTRRIRSVLVGDVWLLGGQSNMEGIGYLADGARPDPSVRAFYMDDRWAVARDPIHNLAQAVDPVHAALNGGQLPQRAAHVGVGPGVPFGQEMFRRTAIPQGLIACAHGGTSMTQWDPAGANDGGKSLYGAMLRRFRKNGSCVAGVVWYQGESDASAAEAPRYTDRMKCLIAAIRRDLRAPQLPFVAVQIGRVCGPGQDSTSWNSIQDQQRRMPGKIRNVAAVPAIDLELDDGIHISGRGQQRLGARLAQAMCALRGGARGERLPIELESVVPQADPLTGSANLLVRFRNVAGRLQAPDRPSGFEIVVGDQPTGSIYRTDLRGTSVLLKTGLPPWDLNTASLSYGHGTVPYCNIADSAGRSLPALGPVPCTTKQTPATPWVNRLMVSQAMPPVRDIRSLAYPKNKRPLGLAMRTFPGVFCDLHMDLFACAPADALVYFLSRFRCAEDMRLAVCVGYDGPVKLWVDRKPRFADPNGTNPATPDRATVPVRLKRGDHEILIGLSSNCGRAWGVFLRLMRKDLTRRQARAGSGAYRMPEWLAPS